MGEIENKNTKTREKRIFRTEEIFNDALNSKKKSHNKAKRNADLLPIFHFYRNNN